VRLQTVNDSWRSDGSEPRKLDHLKLEFSATMSSLANARRTLALWRYDDNNVRPHASLGNKTPAVAWRALALFAGVAPGTLATLETDNYQTQGLSLRPRSGSARAGIIALIGLFWTESGT
jgi:hypothetical protein